MNSRSSSVIIIIIVLLLLWFCICAYRHSVINPINPCDICSTPRPPHVLQVVGDVPGFAPVPSHVVHLTLLWNFTSFSQPFTASIKDTRKPTSMSWPFFIPPPPRPPPNLQEEKEWMHWLYSNITPHTHTQTSSLTLHLQTSTQDQNRNV